MTPFVFAAGVLLILVGLWNRDEEMRALVLFGVGAVLVMIAGLMAMSGYDPQP